MLLSLPFQADRAQIKMRKQDLFEKGLKGEYSKGLLHLYHQGDNVHFKLGQILDLRCPSYELDHFRLRKYLLMALYKFVVAP
jgi:hypothetical protein